MVKKDTIWIISTHGRSQCHLEIDAMNLMISSAESLDILVSRPDPQHLTCLKVARHVRSGGTGFRSPPFADSEKVEGMHCVW
jgi:hypothetical protein